MKLELDAKLYETHLPVSNVELSLKFYTEVLGLKFALHEKKRNIAFVYLGNKEDSMLGLWGPGSGYGPKNDQIITHHFAMKIPLEALLSLPEQLKARGISCNGFYGEEEDLPSVIGWMPSAQIYFKDPDGHYLEYISILEEEPDPDFIGLWSQWKARIANRDRLY